MFTFMRFADPDAAIEWLSRAFGFRPGDVHRGGDGAVQHAELWLGEGAIMLGPGDPSSHGVYVAVDDADALYEQAKAAGAEIVRELEDSTAHASSRCATPTATCGAPARTARRGRAEGGVAPGTMAALPGA